MAFRDELFHRLTQPQGAFRLRRDGPLTDGLTLVALPGFGPVNLVSRYVGESVGAPSITPGPQGLELNTSASGNNRLRFSPEFTSSSTSQSALYDVSVLSALVITYQTSNQNFDYAFGRMNGSGNPGWAVGLHSGSSNGPAAQLGSYNVGGTSGGNRRSGPTVVLLTGDGTTATVYENGAVFASGSYTAPSYDYSTFGGRAVLMGGAGVSGVSQNRTSLGLFWSGRVIPPAVAALLTSPAEVWRLLVEPDIITVPVSAGGGGGTSLDLSGNASLTGAVAASGDLQIVPAPILDLSGAAALAGSLTPSGNLQYTVPVDLVGAASLSGTFTATGDLQYSTAVFLDLSAQPVTLAATFTAAGDLDPYPKLDLSGAQSASLTGAVTLSGALQYGTPFDVSAGVGSPLSAVLGASGELQFSVAPPPPPVQYAVGGGGGGRGLRELTERIGKDAEELLSTAKGTPRERTPRPLAPAPATTLVARSEGSDRRNDRAAAEPAVPGAQKAVLSELHSLRAAVERLEALLLADREAAARKREQDAEEAAVIKLLTG